MKKQESGRSMVEMLGVLAIIGVLSVGGIAGYMLSMNRFRANNLIDKASKFATIAYSTVQTGAAMGKTISATEVIFSDQKLGTIDTTGGESITMGSIDSDGTVKVKVGFGTQGVCETARSILGITATENVCGASDFELTLDFKQS